MAEYYRSSGIVPLGGAAQTLLAGLGAGLPLAVGYSYAIVNIPFAYINVLLTAGLGFAVGAAVTKVARKSRIRNELAPPVIGVVCGIATLYVAWGADALARFGWPKEGGPTLYFDPRVLWSYVQFFYERGFWGLDRDGNVTGVKLAFIWLAEAGVVLGLAAVMPWSELKGMVYCETCDRWTSAESNLLRLAASEADRVLARVEQGDLSVLHEAQRAGVADTAYLSVGVRWCETCTESCYLEIDRIALSVDKHGKEKVVATSVVNNQSIAATDVALLRVMGQQGG